MLKQNISVKDLIQAKVDNYFANTTCFSNLKYIKVESDDIRPSFEMFFQSTLSGKIFKIDKIS